MNIHPDRIDQIILADCISTTGKYYCFLGEHLVQGVQCYDVCAMAHTEEHRGYAIRRHYNSKTTPNAKEIALAYWSEFRDQMTAPRAADEQDEPIERMVVRDGREYVN